jgi:integrase
VSDTEKERERELRKELEAASREERLKFGTIPLTGMLRRELKYLAWQDLKSDLGVILIQSKPGVWDPKTDERVIPISPMVDGMLAEQWKEGRSDTWVFPNRAGNPDKHLLEKMKKICRKAGIEELNVHQLRHSFATILRMKGVALADIADLLGHKDLATTQMYANVQQERLRTAINKLSGVIDPRAPHFCATNPNTATGGDSNLLSDGSLGDA